MKHGKYLLKEKHKYNGQVQLGMGLLNLKKCYLVLYASFDNTFITIEVDFNYEFTKNMLTVVKHNFFEKMLPHLCKKTVNK